MTQNSTYRLHDGETVTVRTSSEESDGALLEVEAEWAPIEVKPFVHLHPHQDERFEITEGELTVKVGDETHVLGAGDALDVPRGEVHSMWNSAETVTRGSWQVRPALDTEGFFRSVHELRESGRHGKNGMPTLAGSGMLLQRFADEVRLPMPGGVQRALATVLASAARLRGYPELSPQRAS